MARRRFTPTEWLFLLLLLSVDVVMLLVPVRPVPRWFPLTPLAVAIGYGVFKIVPQIARDLRDTVHPPPMPRPGRKLDTTPEAR